MTRPGPNPTCPTADRLLGGRACRILGFGLGAALVLGGCGGGTEGTRFTPASGDEPARAVGAGESASGPARPDRTPVVRRIEMH